MKEPVQLRCIAIVKVKVIKKGRRSEEKVNKDTK